MLTYGDTHIRYAGKVHGHPCFKQNTNNYYRNVYLLKSCFFFWYFPLCILVPNGGRAECRTSDDGLGPACPVRPARDRPRPALARMDRVTESWTGTRAGQALGRRLSLALFAMRQAALIRNGLARARVCEEASSTDKGTEDDKGWALRGLNAAVTREAFRFLERSWDRSTQTPDALHVTPRVIGLVYLRQPPPLMILRLASRVGQSRPA